jgi:hypothetical protein
MRAEPLARRTLTTLEAKAGASSGNNASSSPREIKRWPITTPGKARASIADWSEESTVIIILAGIIGFVDRAHFGTSKHATLGSTIPPAINGSHGATVIVCPARAN